MTEEKDIVSSGKIIQVDYSLEIKTAYRLESDPVWKGLLTFDLKDVYPVDLVSCFNAAMSPDSASRYDFDSWYGLMNHEHFRDLPFLEKRC
jgi:hypothetical protein